MEERTVTYCAHCLEAIEGEEYYNYDGTTLCQKCYDEANDVYTVIDFIGAYPKDFLDYLKECVICTDEINELICHMLEDYREFNQREFDRWVVS